MRLYDGTSIVLAIICICARLIAALAFVRAPPTRQSFLKELFIPRLGRVAAGSWAATASPADNIDIIIDKLRRVARGNADERIAEELIVVLGEYRKELTQSIIAAPLNRLALLLERQLLIIRHPALAERILQPNSFVLPTDQWFYRYLNLSASDAAQIVSRWPSSGKHIQSLGRHRLKQWFAFFLSKEVGLTDKQLRKIVISRPLLLSYKLSNVQATTNFFKEEVGLANAEYTSLVQSYPSVVTYSINKRLRPHVSFLQNEIGGGKDNWTAWRKVICSYPQFFSHSLEKTLIPKVNFLCDKTGNSLCLKRSELSQVVAKFPPTLWLSEDNLKEKFDFLTNSLDLTARELREIIVTYPQLLGLSLEHNLRPKMAFLLASNAEETNGIGYGGLSKRELKGFVLYQPALLAYSLEGRLKPRIRLMQENNISFCYCPKNIMSYTDKKFATWMETQISTWTIIG
eukprot:CCRYP_009110-RA/>CCRYP_009110-RA protein AED:0.01 eAED:0.01 QI:195/1/1/1/1/1/2/1408/458